jgi:hypothetical protein
MKIRLRIHLYIQKCSILFKKPVFLIKILTYELELVILCLKHQQIITELKIPGGTGILMCKTTLFNVHLSVIHLSVYNISITSLAYMTCLLLSLAMLKMSNDLSKWN